MDDVKDPRLIVDCGANVGYASVHFLNRFPNCRLIAVEPDKENFEILQRNLAPYAQRIHLINSGVWSHPVPLKMNEVPYLDGREWARQVRECANDEAGAFMATDIASILIESGADRISILKMDIERAEAEVFAHNYEAWIDRVDNIVIELHDAECRAIFLRAIEKVSFENYQWGELTVCKKRGNSAHSSPAGAR